MSKKIMGIFLILPIIFSMSGCKKVVDNFSLNVGENSVTTAANFVADFGFNVTKSVDIVVKGVKYGTVGVAAANNGEPFKVFVTGNLDMFTSDVWEGFTPVTTLPDGELLPSWVQPAELIRVDIPNFTEHLDLTVYVGYKNPYYVGVALGLKVLDGRYPDGLSLSQVLKKSGKTWGQAMVYGPTYDDEGNVSQHGGLFFLAGFSKGKIININIDKFKKEDSTLKRIQ